MLTPRPASIAAVAALFSLACSTAPFLDGENSGGGGPDGGPVDPGQPGPDGGFDPGPDANPADLAPYADLHYASTHNSYSGGARGSLIEQLDRGVRVIELDVHDDSFGTSGYRIGHDSPGHEVASGGGNPQSDALADWLDVVASWSESHPNHAPITILLDLKDRIDDNWSYGDGNLARLNRLLEDTFGSRLHHAADSTSSMPTIGELRGRIVTVLSGSESTRMGYRRDRGHNPAVAIDSSGRVIEVHNSGGGELWYWAGEIQPGGTILWHRHGRYDTGEDPSVALNENGLVVEVHEDEDVGDETLWYRVGQLTSDFEIDWYHGGGLKFPGDDSGVNPGVRFTDRDGPTVREIHQSENTGDHWYWNGVFNPSTSRIEWSRESADGGETSDPLYNTGRDATGGLAVEVSRGSVGPYASSAVRYTTPQVSGWRTIRYQQILFVEAQAGGNSQLAADDLWFYAAGADSASGRSFVEGWRSAGRVVRLWGFNSPTQDTDPPVNFPATDEPAASWYLQHCLDLDCRE